MRQPFRGGISLRVFALLTFLVAALSSFGQAPPLSKDPGFTLGVQESGSTMFNTDVTGATTINPYVAQGNGNAFSHVNVRGVENVQVGENLSATGFTGLNIRPLFGFTKNLR